MMISALQLINILDLSAFELNSLIVSLNQVDERRVKNRIKEAGRTTDISEGIVKYKRRDDGTEGDGLFVPES